MAKIMTILAMLMLAVSVLLGVIDTVNAVALAVAGGLVFAAIKFKVSAWAALFLCCLSGVAMAAGTTGDVSSWIGTLYSLTSSWAGWGVIGPWLLGAHVVASIYVNVTDTPDDNSKYGKIYKNVIEPVAGVLVKDKIKQKPFSQLYK